MTKKEAKLLGLDEFNSPVYGKCYFKNIGGLPMGVIQDGDNEDVWFLTIDLNTQKIKYYIFVEAQAILNNLEKHSNG